MKPFEQRLYDSQENPLALQAVNVILRRIHTIYGDEIIDNLTELQGAIRRLTEITFTMGAVTQSIQSKRITK